MTDLWEPSRVVTTREEGTNRRVNEKGTARRTVWYRTYKQRIRQGVERCRWCSSTQRKLTFGHILSHARGGQYKFDNLTILCEPCNRRMADRTWPGLRSLQEEEAAAPPAQRWAALAWEDERQRAKGVIRKPMSPEREAMVPWVMAILIANGPDGEPMDVGEVRARLRLNEEDEKTVHAALRAASRRGMAILDEATQGYVCVPGARVPAMVAMPTRPSVAEATK